MQKYKVFLNEKRILFDPSAKITLRKKWPEQANFTSKKGVTEWLENFERSDEVSVVFGEHDKKTAFESFRNSMINIDAAGGVVRRNGTLLFIFRNEKWDLPKGKIDKGETPETAALREVEEECGISHHQIIRELPSTYHIFRSPYRKLRGKWIFKETFWYEMAYSGEENGVPQKEEGITEIRWFRPNELDEVLGNTYENLQQLIELYRY